MKADHRREERPPGSVTGSRRLRAPLAGVDDRRAARGTAAVQRPGYRLGIPRDTLIGRLRRLEANGLVTREPCQFRPVRQRYCLTAAGQELGEITSLCSRRLPEKLTSFPARGDSGSDGAPEKRGPP